MEVLTLTFCGLYCPEKLRRLRQVVAGLPARDGPRGPRIEGEDMASGNDRAVRPGIQRHRFIGLLAVLSVATLGAAGCNSGGGGGTTNTNPDNGTQLTMWVRSATDQFSKRLVDAYNASHQNKVELT